MLWVILFVIGIAPSLVGGVLALSSKTRRYALWPVWCALSLVGVAWGLVCAAPVPRPEEGPGATIGSVLLTTCPLAVPVVTACVGIGAACFGQTRRYAARVFASLLAFALAASIAFGIGRTRSGWAERECNGQLSWGFWKMMLGAG
jgi:hypothetical protein